MCKIKCDHNYNSLLNANQFNKELVLRGYEFGKSYRMIDEISADGRYARGHYAGDLHSYLNTIFNMALLHGDYRDPKIFKGLNTFKCDPKVLFNLSRFER